MSSSYNNKKRRTACLCTHYIMLQDKTRQNNICTITQNKTRHLENFVSLSILIDYCLVFIILFKVI